jgi:hypothetical protein
MLKLIYCPTITLKDLQKAYTLLAVDHFDGNKTQAANALGITLKTLYNRLDDYGIDYTFKPWVKGQADPSLVVQDFPPLISANQLPGVL